VYDLTTVISLNKVSSIIQLKHSLHLTLNVYLDSIPSNLLKLIEFPKD